MATATKARGKALTGDTAPTNKRPQGPVPSGWCLTGHHAQCPTTFPGGRTCVCPCHQGGGPAP